MNAYEITFIIRPDLDEEQTRAVAAQVTGRLESAGGEIIALYPWSPSRRRMAYPIRDFGDGFYATATFRIDPQALREVENALKLNDRLLRFLIVQATEQMIKQSQQRAHQQSAAGAPPAQPVPATPGAPEPAVAVPQGTEPVQEAAPAAVVAEPVVPAESTEAPPVEATSEPVATAAEAEE